MENKRVGLIMVIAIVIVIIVGGVIGAVAMLDDKVADKGNINQGDNSGDEKTEVKLDYNDIDFAFKFLKLEKRTENIVYSPLSIKYALSMLSDGASGNTKTQIENVIGDSEFIKHNSIDKVLSLANAIYIRDTYKDFVKEEYKSRLVKKYEADIKVDAFANAQNVNKWIEDKTMGQLKNMLSDEIVQDPYAEMILINALALNMDWKEQFDGNNTSGATFKREDGTSKIATMMNRETTSDNVAYFKDKNITVLTMNLKKYQDEEMEFMIIMPNDNLANYVQNFRADDLEEIINNLTLASKTKYGVTIFVPKFSFDYNLNLKEDLKSLGITDAFNPSLANFSNISSSPIPLWVGDALHKANIDFTEDGVKASAATVIVMKNESMMDIGNRSIEIKIDKPFMYLIKSKNTNEIWFAGTVYNPNSWEDDKVDYGY